MDNKEWQFKKYGFEVPDFECEILKEVKQNEEEYYYIGFVSGIDCPTPICWNYKGKSFLIKDYEVHLQSKFDLTPIKKQWYEDKSNFPCILTENNNFFILCPDKDVWIDFYKNHKGNFRLATKEEVLSLYKEVK